MSGGKRYLGDGAYVELDGYALVLTTENGITVTDRIVLEPMTFDALWRYVEDLKQADPAPAADAVGEAEE